MTIRERAEQCVRPFGDYLSDEGKQEAITAIESALRGLGK